jgi:hypothetical protein
MDKGERGTTLRKRRLGRAPKALLTALVVLGIGLPAVSAPIHAGATDWADGCTTWGGNLTPPGWQHANWCIIPALQSPTLCMDAGAGTSGSLVALEPCGRSLGQDWTFIAVYSFMGVLSQSWVNYLHHTCLDASGGAQRAELHVYNCSSTASQAWFPNSPYNNSIQNSFVTGSRCLDDWGGGQGQIVRMYGCYGGINQQWGHY